MLAGEEFDTSDLFQSYCYTLVVQHRVCLTDMPQPRQHLPPQYPKLNHKHYHKLPLQQVRLITNS